MGIIDWRKKHQALNSVGDTCICLRLFTSLHLHSHRPISQITWCIGRISHNAHFVTEMCTLVHISVTKWCSVGYSSNTLWDLCHRWHVWNFVMIVRWKIFKRKNSNFHYNGKNIYEVDPWQRVVDSISLSLPNSSKKVVMVMLITTKVPPWQYFCLSNDVISM